MAVSHDAASESGIIYGLCDPDTGELRYVGKTAGSPKARRADHMRRARNGAATHLSNWLRGLHQPPIIRILQDGILLDELEDRECVWIAACRGWGVRLTNGTAGGDGGPTFRGRRHTPETLAKMSAAARLRGISQVTREASAAVRRGKPLTAEHRAKIGLAHRGNQYGRGYKHTPEAIAKIGAASIARRSADNLTKGR